MHEPRRNPVGASEEAGSAIAEQGVVLLDGPDAIALSLTPEAAERTGASLIAAARTAREQAAHHVSVRLTWDYEI